MRACAPEPESPGTGMGDDWTSLPRSTSVADGGGSSREDRTFTRSRISSGSSGRANTAMRERPMPFPRRPPKETVLFRAVELRGRAAETFVTLFPSAS